MVPAGETVRGRVLDAMGRPIDGKGPLRGTPRTPLMVEPPNPLLRRRITEPLSTGVRAIDSMLTVGVGQRVGIFAAAGGGKSTLLSMITRYVDADTVVMALIGERGRGGRGVPANDPGGGGMKGAPPGVSPARQPRLLRLK